MKHVVITGSYGKSVIMVHMAKVLKDRVTLISKSPIEDKLRVKEVLSFEELFDAKKAVIVKEKCVPCDECLKACAKGAITPSLEVDWELCEGCPACAYACPRNAITFTNVLSGYIKVYLADAPVVEYYAKPWLNKYLVARWARDIAKRLAQDEGSEAIIEEFDEPLPWAKVIYVANDEAELRLAPKGSVKVCVGCKGGDFDVPVSDDPWRDPEISKVVSEMAEVMI